jgi:phage replication-related protein YjqB (UPF0714/DUF867 family)
MSNNEELYTARFKPRDDLHDLPKEHCSANVDQIKTIGRDLYQQVRLELPTANGIIPAIYTVGNVHEEGSDLVYVGKKIEQYVKCLEPYNTDPCEGKVKAEVTKDLNEDDARLQGEFIEQLSDNGQNQKLVVIAPHGGEIESKTDKQAEIVRNEISPDEVSLWICKGFDEEDKSAYERWHITSTEISEKSFPKLNTIYGPKFEYSIAFHGWDRDNICVGGRKDNNTVDKLKVEIKDAIEKTLKEQGSNIQVNVSGCPECPGAFNGDKDENIVNRLGTNGIQIEQCSEARKQYYSYIAKAVADTIRPRINV